MMYRRYRSGSLFLRGWPLGLVAGVAGAGLGVMVGVGPAQSQSPANRLPDRVPLEEGGPPPLPGVRPRTAAPAQAVPVRPLPDQSGPRQSGPRQSGPRQSGSSQPGRWPLPPLNANPANPNLANPSQPPTALNQTYTLGPSDRLLVRIFNVPEFSGEQQILADGTLNLPIIGQVSVNGMTLKEAGRAIAKAYSVEIVNPDVTVILLKPRPLRVAIAGEVSRPGLYTLAGNETQFPSVAQAIQAAGGVTQAADLKQVKLRRTIGHSSPGQISTQTVLLDLWELLATGDVSQDWPLRDGDAIIIPETTSVNIAETNRLSFSNLSASNLAASTGESMVVGVIGEVFRPGAYELGGTKGRITITKAIQTAGGIKPSANIRQVQVRRVTRNGAEQLINLDFWQLLHSADLTQDLLLQQGDTVIIPIADALTPSEIAQITTANLSPDKIRVNIVGEVAKPGPVEVAANTTLSQAVLAAGGFNQRASEEVELIRLNPNGSVLSQKIRVNVRQNLNAEKNPIVLNNDVIIVGLSRGAKILDQIDSVLGPVLRIFSPLRGLFNSF